MTRRPAMDRILFGAAYYTEYQPTDRLKTDLDLMAEAGFSVIRVGESVWSTWEPRPGVFDLDWLQPVLDGAAERDISVILGTPTYACPPWLQRMHPEIAAVNADGSTVGWGARQEMDYTHPAFQHYAERVIRKIIPRYAGHPALIGYQVDNEPGQQLPHNDHVFAGFLDYLRDRYGDVDTLNREWGLVYWSHRLSDWADLWRPKGNLMPQYQLEWRRYQSMIMTDYIAWQADIVREYARDDQFVTTCISYSRPPVADDQLVARLDVTAGNPYYRMQDGLARPSTEQSPEGWWSSGVWALHQQADRMYASGQDRFLVTETNAQPIGGPWSNQPPYPGQIIQAALALVSRGAAMIEYWHWHTLHFGVETYWGGILPHSQRPGRIYREVADLGSILQTIGPRLEGYRPDADAGIIYSEDTRWSYQFYPPLATRDGGPDHRSYEAIFDAFYRGASDAGLQLNILHDRQFAELDPAELASRLPILFAPSLYVTGDASLRKLVEYAAAGGHLVIGIRTGYGDDLARARAAVAPDGLSDAAGVWYEEYHNLDHEVALEPAAGLQLSADARATRWADGLIVEGATVLAGYRHHDLGRFAAITSTDHGAGRITYVGTVPNPALAADLARWLQPEPIAAAWTVPDTVTVTSGRTAAGPVWFVHNWSGQAATVTPPPGADLTDLVAGEVRNAPFTLDAWSASVLVDGADA